MMVDFRRLIWKEKWRAQPSDDTSPRTATSVSKTAPFPLTSRPSNPATTHNADGH